MPGFELSKWYADCVTARGDALILYSAELRWAGLPIAYSSLLELRDGGPVRTRYSLRRQAPPAAGADGIDWKSKAWKAEGRWSNLGSGVREVLFDSPEGMLEWNCVAPRCAARLRIAADDPYSGWGYVEHLRLTLAPWRLPIRQLRWGRFVNATDALVWIDWRGSYNRQVVYHNGAAVSARAIGDGEIALAEERGILSLEPAAVLRDGALGATALAVLPNPGRLFPARMLQVRECKWLSRATLRRPGRPDSTGMAIHEVIEWP
jgi:hypothetical protein